ncbi:hypothetical protein K440DRAFT_636934 [Wilcoxina mikolae CBS 423.85]|nr:hypothetical protein K440DRAFT_636934 [Wilcoxina mikolae CBS 423.85]
MPQGYPAAGWNGIRQTTPANVQPASWEPTVSTVNATEPYPGFATGLTTENTAGPYSGFPTGPSTDSTAGPYLGLSTEPTTAASVEPTLANSAQLPSNLGPEASATASIHHPDRDKFFLSVEQQPAGPQDLLTEQWKILHESSQENARPQFPCITLIFLHSTCVISSKLLCIFPYKLQCPAISPPFPPQFPSYARYQTSYVVQFPVFSCCVWGPIVVVTTSEAVIMVTIQYIRSSSLICSQHGGDGGGAGGGGGDGGDVTMMVTHILAQFVPVGSQLEPVYPRPLVYTGIRGWKCSDGTPPQPPPPPQQNPTDAASPAALQSALKDPFEIPAGIGGFWCSQIDTVPGFMQLGVVVRYKQRWNYSNVERHIRMGESTYPFYTFNARGGQGLEIDWNALSATPLLSQHPPLDLYLSYEAQLMSYGVGSLEAADLFSLTNSRLSELMVIVEEILNHLYWEWASVERIELDGGYQKLGELAESVKDLLRTKELSEPEEIVVAVASLRALKIAMLHLVGANVYEARELLEKDFPAYLVQSCGSCNTRIHSLKT